MKSKENKIQVNEKPKKKTCYNFKVVQYLLKKRIKLTSKIKKKYDFEVVKKIKLK